MDLEEGWSYDAFYGDGLMRGLVSHDGGVIMRGLVSRDGVGLIRGLVSHDGGGLVNTNNNYFIQNNNYFIQPELFFSSENIFCSFIYPPACSAPFINTGICTGKTTRYI